MYHTVSSFAGFVPFSLLQALLVARSCYCRSLHLPSFTPFFPELSLFIRFCKLSLPTVVYPLEQATIVRASSPILCKLSFAPSRLLFDLELLIFDKRRCTYIGHSNQTGLRKRLVDLVELEDHLSALSGGCSIKSVCFEYVSPSQSPLMSALFN